MIDLVEELELESSQLIHLLRAANVFGVRFSRIPKTSMAREWR